MTIFWQLPHCIKAKKLNITKKQEISFMFLLVFKCLMCDINLKCTYHVIPWPLCLSNAWGLFIIFCIGYWITIPLSLVSGFIHRSVPILSPLCHIIVELAPPVPDVEVLSPTEVKVSWEPITQGVQIRRYSIQYKNLTNTRSKLWYTVEGSDGRISEYRIGQLKPGKKKAIS